MDDLKESFMTVTKMSMDVAERTDKYNARLFKVLIISNVCWAIVTMFVTYLFYSLT